MLAGKEPLKPFDGEELIDKSIKCFHRLRPYFGECLEIMKAEDLDLESKEVCTRWFQLSFV